MALLFILNLVSFGAQFSDNPGDVNHVPGHHSISLAAASALTAIALAAY